ncbi:uncharacterized protein LOC111704696, partial [Eurytemora carolleeae]|uniref:uncharacterized protein LOC111704696 n=1 Tax=Eurytemora carolleeae TaxID=1294199 RepID=UPI000C76C74D
MAELEMRMNPFEDVYTEFFMEKAVRLGSGSFGKVYLIQRRKDGGTFAAKYQQLSGNNSKRSVRIEAEMLSRLYKQKRMESSILVLVGYYETSLHTLLVTEYLEGG